MTDEELAAIDAAVGSVMDPPARVLEGAGNAAIERSRQVLTSEPSQDEPVTAMGTPLAAVWKDQALVGRSSIDAAVDRVLEDEDVAKDNRVGALFEAGLSKDLDTQTRVLELARKARLPSDIVEASLPEFERTWQASQFDARKWRKENPELARLVLERPDLAPIVTKDEKLSLWQKAWRQAVAWHEQRDAATAEADAAYKAKFQGRGVVSSREFGAAYKEKVAQVDARLAGPEAQEAIDAAGTPRQQEQIEDNKVQVAREMSGLQRVAIPYIAYRDAARQSELVALGRESLFTALAGGDLYELEKRAVDLEREMLPRDYGSGAIEQLFVDAATILPSQLQVIQGAGAGAAVGAVVGGVVTRSLQGASAGAKIVAKLGASLAAFDMESSSSFLEFRRATTDAGERITAEQAAGAALLYGAAAAGIEGLSFGATEAQGKAFLSALLKDEGFRLVAARAARSWVEKAGKAGVEETLQTIAQDVTGYLARSDRAGELQRPDVVGSVENALTAGLTAGPASLVTGSGGFALTLGTLQLRRDVAIRSGKQVASLAQLAESPSVRAAPAAVARMVAEESAKSGQPLTSLYVDAEAFVRLFQGQKADPDAAARELLGEAGAEQLKEAIATGQKLQVPLPAYLEKWGPKPVAEALAQHTTTTPNGETAAQAKQLEAQAAELAKGFDPEKEVPAGVEAEVVEHLQKQLADTGVYSEKRAKTAVGLVRSFIRTQAARFDLPADMLFSRYLVTIQKEGFRSPSAQALVAPVSPEASKAAIGTIGTWSVQERADRRYLDPVSGLRHSRAFAALPVPEGKQVAVITSPSIKPINDAPGSGGHHVSDELLRAWGKVLFDAGHTEAARSGTNLLLHVADKAELDQLQAQLRAITPNEAVAIRGHLGAQLGDVQKQLNDAIKNERAPDPGETRSADLGPPTLPSRKASAAEIGLDPSTLSFPEGRATAEVPSELVERIRGLSDEAYFNEVVLDHLGTGLLSRDGWELTPRKKHVVMLDAQGLKEINDKLGPEMGDEFLRQFGSMIRDLGGSDFDAAHLSGDEYALQSDDKEALEAYVALLSDVAYHVGAQLELKGESLFCRIQFWDGQSNTLEAADAELNRRKAEAGDAGESPRDYRSRVAGAEAGRGEGDRDLDVRPADLEARRDALKRRARSQGFPGSTRPADDGAGHRRLTGRLEQPSRGYLDRARVGAQQLMAIFLRKDADLSTFLHETAHTFLDMVGDLAAREDAPAALKADFQATLAWMGVASREEITPAHHEKWAGSFEAYLLEGKSPTAQLRQAFDQFRLWLTGIYKSAVPNDADLNPEIRGVFDRLLATDEEIERAKQRMGIGRPVFRTPEEAGMTPEEFQRYLKEQEEALSHTARVAELRALKDRLRVTEAWWREEEGKLRDQLEDEYDARPDVRADRYIRRGELVLDDGRTIQALEMGRIDRAAAEEMLGPDAAKRLLGNRMVKQGGEHPDDVAELFGYPTGGALFKAIQALPPKADWVRETAAQQMAERHPDILSDRDQLRAIAEQGLHGEQNVKWLFRELIALRKRAGLDGQPPLASAFARAAEQMVERRTIGTLNASRALQAERSAADKALKAVAKGDFGQAYTLKLQQLLNMNLWKALEAAREEREAFLDLAADLRKDKSRARLGKAHLAFRDGVDTILEVLALRPQVVRDTPALPLTATIRAMEDSGASVMFDEEMIQELVAEPRSYKRLTVGEMRGVVAALKNIKKASTALTTAVVDGKRVDKEQLSADLVVEAAANMPLRKNIPSSEAAMGAVDEGFSLVSWFDGGLLRPETMLAEFMGGEANVDSLWFKAFIQPLQEAKVRESDLYRQTIRPIVEALDAMPAEVRRRWFEKVDGEALFPGHREGMDPPTRLFEIGMMFLNAGNEGNLQRLLDGRGITPAELAAALDLLPKEMTDYLQGVLDQAESLWPLSRALEERDSGVAPPKVVATPIVTKHGTYRGGYFPIVFDRRVSKVGERQAVDSIASMMDQSYSRPGTSRKHLKHRVDKVLNAAIALDPTAIKAHLAQVTHDIAFREAIRSVGGLLLDEGVQGALRSHLGHQRAGYLLRYAQDVGQMRGAEVASHLGKLDSLVRGLRSNMVLYTLGYGVDIAMGDVSNLGVALAATGLKKEGLAAGLAEFAKDMPAMRRMTLEKSGELRFRQDTLEQRFSLAIAKMSRRNFRGRGGYDAFKKHAWTAFDVTEAATATPIWIGAYRQGLQEGRDEKGAVTFADSVVRAILPSKSVVDQSAAQRDRGFIGTLLVFQGFQNVAYNRRRVLGHQTYEALRRRDFRRAGKAAAATFGLLVSYGVWGELFSGRGREEDDEGEKEEWLTLFVRKLFGAYLYPVPGAGMVETAVTGKGYVGRGIPAFAGADALSRAFSSLMAVINGEEDAVPGFADDAAEAAGLLKGVPLKRPGRTAEYLWDVSTGEDPPEDPLEFLDKVIRGNRPNRPSSALSEISDAVSGE